MRFCRKPVLPGTGRYTKRCPRDCLGGVFVFPGQRCDSLCTTSPASRDGEVRAESNKAGRYSCLSCLSQQMTFLSVASVGADNIFLCHQSKLTACRRPQPPSGITSSLPRNIRGDDLHCQRTRFRSCGCTSAARSKRSDDMGWIFLSTCVFGSDPAMPSPGFAVRCCPHDW